MGPQLQAGHHDVLAAGHAVPSLPATLSTVHAMRVAVLAVDGMLDSGFASVLDGLTAANVLHTEAGLAAAPFEIAVVGRGRRVRTGHGLSVPTLPWRDVAADPPDLLVMPSIGVRSPSVVVDVVRRHPALVHVEQWCASGVAMAAACSGTFFLAEAGVLDGLRATTSWWLADAFRERYPRVDLDETRVVVHDGVTTAGAGYAHLDLALALVTAVSPALSDLTAAYLVAGRRDVQVGVFPTFGRVVTAPLLVSFERYARAHLREAPSIGVIARAIGTSERTLQRVMADALGTSPTRYLQQLRLTHAIHLLATTDRSTAAVAESVGYHSADALRAVLRRRRGHTVSQARGVTRSTPPQ